MTKRHPFGKATKIFDAAMTEHPFGGMVITGHEADGTPVIDSVVYFTRNEVGTPARRFNVKTRSANPGMVRSPDVRIDAHPMSPRARKG
jgi:hypothetical protein